MLTVLCYHIGVESYGAKHDAHHNKKMVPTWNIYRCTRRYDPSL